MARVKGPQRSSQTLISHFSHTLSSTPRRLAHTNVEAIRRRAIGALDGSPASPAPPRGAPQGAPPQGGGRQAAVPQRTWVGWMWGAPAPSSSSTWSSSGGGRGSPASAVPADGAATGEQAGLDRDEWKQLEMLVAAEQVTD